MTFSAHDEDLPRFAELEAEYELLGELGRGGTAVVYLARERELGRRVAIKVIRATYVEDEEAAARLMREAQTVAGLQHPNIVMLYGTRRLRDNSLALIMQYVEGRTLKEEVQACGALPFERAEQILADLASALAYAHKRRIVHRDIKPENIYVDADTGTARLSDFGIARAWDTDSSLTLPGSAIGTPAYMSPEQIDGGDLDGRSDLYSLGLVGYEIVAGTRPWTGETLFNIVVKQKHQELPSLVLLRPDIPRNLQQAIEGALRKKVDQRWQDADAFLRVLCGRPVVTANAAAPAAPSETPVLPATASVQNPPRRPLPEADTESLTVQFRRPDAAPEPTTVGAKPERHKASAAKRPRPNAAAGSVSKARGPRGAAANVQEQSPVARSTKPAVVTAVKAPPARWPLIAAAVAGLMVVGTAMTMVISREMGVVEPPADAAADASPPPAAPVAGSAPAPAGTAAVAFALYGDLQTGPSADTFPQPVMLRVEDAAGRPVVGATVRFAVVMGDGVVRPDSVVTDDAGTASARWLPRRPGVHAVQARIAGLTDAITFQARALPRPAARLSAVSATEIRGSAGVAAPIAVRVEDDRGNPVPDVQVRFAVQSGEGRISPASSVTGSDGVARAQWTPGANGVHQALANVAELKDANVVFKATAAPPPVAVRRTVAVGGTHTCLLSGDGTATCWGGNDSGQLGDGSAIRRASPVRVAAPEALATIAAGVTHSCAVGVSGAVFCWGANTSGQLGDGTRTSRTQPSRVSMDQSLASVAVGMAHSCGLDASGRLFCWGQNSYGQLGDGTQTDRTTPVRAGGARTYRSVAVGWAHTCGLSTDGAAYCWGRNGSGELGSGTNEDRAVPARVTGGHRFTAIAAGSAHTCGILADGAALCWGANSHGQLGNGATASSPMPVNVLGQEPFATLSTGGVHTCGLTREGSAQCWGRNTYGQLGDGTAEDRTRPAAVAGGHRFTSIFASGAHTCATAAGGALHCWGFNLEGQIGDGTRSNQLRPVPVGRQG